LLICGIWTLGLFGRLGVVTARLRQDIELAREAAVRTVPQNYTSAGRVSGETTAEMLHALLSDVSRGRIPEGATLKKARTAVLPRQPFIDSPREHTSDLSSVPTLLE